MRCLFDQATLALKCGVNRGTSRKRWPGSDLARDSRGVSRLGRAPAGLIDTSWETDLW